MYGYNGAIAFFMHRRFFFVRLIATVSFFFSQDLASSQSLHVFELTSGINASGVAITNDDPPFFTLEEYLCLKNYCYICFMVVRVCEITLTYLENVDVGDTKLMMN